MAEAGTDEAGGPLWVFGYGSLIWNPGFAPAESRLAMLEGFRRSFCMTSIHHRGTEADPGLVLALDRAPGWSCRGVAFRVRAEEEAPVLAELRARELISSAYVEERLEVSLDGGGRIEALAYIIDRDHVQYCGGMALERQAGIIARAIGGRGPNDEYLFRTAEHLAKLGLEDEDLAWLERRVRELKDTAV